MGAARVVACSWKRLSILRGFDLAEVRQEPPSAPAPVVGSRAACAMIDGILDLVDQSRSESNN